MVNKWMMLMLSLLILTMAVPAAADETGKSPEPLVVQVDEIDQSGNIQLALKGTKLLESGFDYGDIAAVTLNNVEYKMPVVSSYSDVDQGAMLCKIGINPEKGTDKVDLAVNMGNFAEWAGIAVREETDEAPGYRWILSKGVTEPISVTLALDEKGGYNEQLRLHKLTTSNTREDFPDLDDEAYANFREVATTGMGDHVLYRSSSPINPKSNRNKEADAACKEHGIKTILNMTDSDKTMRAYEGFDSTYYSTCHILCLNMVMDYKSDSFRKSLADGFAFIAGQEGPYLIHCAEGKDRTGFACAVLEALMGANEDEIVQDYMTSFENYFGVKPGSEMYDSIVNANIKKILANAFELDTLEGADLPAEAEKYVKGLGLADETIRNLKKNLAAS